MEGNFPSPVTSDFCPFKRTLTALASPFSPPETFLLGPELDLRVDTWKHMPRLGMQS